MLIRAAEVAGRRVDVRIRDGLVAELAPDLARESGEEVIDAAGGGLLPGLHDHHLHLLAMAAAARSIRLGPPNILTAEGFSRALRAAARRAAPGEWVRAVGYHESVHGGMHSGIHERLNRDVLDHIVADRPVRVQHRAGALWVLNSAGLRALHLEQESDADVERDASGRLTGRLLRWDAQLGERLRRRRDPADDSGVDGPDPRTDLRTIGDQLSRFGITGVTDATPDLGPAALALLETATVAGVLPQRLLLLGAAQGLTPTARIAMGPHKILLRDHDLPGMDELAERIFAAHTAGRPVAVHCVTRESLLLTLATFDAVGTLAGDRIEHGAVVPPELYSTLAAGGLCVVTQPAFITERGDSYLADVDPADLPSLYPYASLLEAGIAVAPSSDAPFGELDPWKVMAAAGSRLTQSGQLLGRAERVPAATALAGYLSPAAYPGGPPRQVAPGAPADLCLLSVPLEEALRGPDAQYVAFTMCDGTLRFSP